MKMRWIIAGMGLLLATSVFAQSTTGFVNPQLSMMSARHMSLGGTNPVISGDSGGLFINPASIGTSSLMPFSITQRKILDQIEVMGVHLAYPVAVPLSLGGQTITKRFNLGLSYGTNTLSGIPDTIFEDSSRIRQIGTFTSGFDVIQLTAASEFLDQFGFDSISAGAAFKRVGQRIAGDSRSGFGIDLGAIGTRYIGASYIDKVHAGASVVNFLSTQLEWSGGQGTSTQPFDIFFGGRVDMFDERLSVFGHNKLDGVSFGAEYYLQKTLSVRGSSDFDSISLGTGLEIEGLVGAQNDNYSMRLDFNFTQNAFPFNNDPNYALSLSILGSSRPQTPQIISPATNRTVQNREINIAGTGPKDTTIRIYNNESLVRTTSTDRFGQWSYKKLPLKEGENVLKVKSYSILRDHSIASDPIAITADTLPPELDVRAFRRGSTFVIQVNSEEAINKIVGELNGRRLKFRYLAETQWEARTTIPQEFIDGTPPPKVMSSLKLTAKDEAGNTASDLEFPFFVSLDFPKDRTVHYLEQIRFIGLSSKLTQKIVINGVEAPVDNDNHFALSVPLEPGKNLVTMDIHSGGENPIQHTLRILRLVTFPDVLNEGLFSQIKERREIEFLATLGVLHGNEDGNFDPDGAVDRRYITEVLVRNGDYDVPTDVEEDVFDDVPADDPSAPYVKVAVENGLAFAYPDGTFKPDRPLTMSEVVFMLNVAGFLGEEATAPADTGYVTRKALAQFLAESPKYEAKIERLIDWRRGY